MDWFLIWKSNSEKDKTANNTVENEEAGGSGVADADMEAQPNKKRKVRALEAGNRQFQEKWTDKFFFVLNESGTKPLCLICNQSCSVFKRNNLKRHYTTTHADFHGKYPPGSNLWKNKIKQLTASLKGRQKLLGRSTSVCKTLTEA